MFGLPLLSWALRLLGQHTANQTDERQLRRELLAHRRRQLIHARIPDVYAAQEFFGPRFEELLLMLRMRDVAGAGAAHAYYPELTRTVLYQFNRATCEEQLLQLLRQEQGLWFGSSKINEVKLADLAQEVRQWQVAAGL